MTTHIFFAWLDTPPPLSFVPTRLAAWPAPRASGHTLPPRDQTRQVTSRVPGPRPTRLAAWPAPRASEHTLPPRDQTSQVTSRIIQQDPQSNDPLHASPLPPSDRNLPSPSTYGSSARPMTRHAPAWRTGQLTPTHAASTRPVMSADQPRHKTPTTLPPRVQTCQVTSCIT